LPELTEIFKGVYLLQEDGDRRLATRNAYTGFQLSGEKVVRIGGEQFRLWSPYRSKLAAAILKGMSEFPLRAGDRVLYLGAASGTTASYISDIVGPEGVVFCIEFAPRPLKELLRVSQVRTNMVPILADARHPSEYSHLVTEVNMVYQDVAQPNQAEIFCSNASSYLAEGGWGLLMVKSRSVDVSKPPEVVYDRERKLLTERGFSVVETLDLEPYDRDHTAMRIAT